MASNDLNPVGILHPGEMGVSIAATAITSGHEVLWASAGRSATTRARAESRGLSDAGTLEALLARCPVVLGVCPPHAAEQMATSVIEAGFRGIYVDANAIAPDRSIAIGHRMETAGVRFVDGGIVGEPAWKPGTTWLHLSGPDAAVVGSLFGAGPLQTTDLGPGIGRASALKMCFAANTKGTRAMLAAILGVAEHLDVREALEAQWDARSPGMTADVHKRVRNVASRAWRFAGEMEEISTTFSAAGMPGGFHDAAREVYTRLAGYKDVESVPEVRSMIDTLLIGDRHPEARGTRNDGGATEGHVDIRPATPGDIGSLLALIRGLAEYENMSDQVSATEDGLRSTLFGPRPAAEALVAEAVGEAVGMAIFFHTYSTFRAQQGLYLEDLFVVPERRGGGIGRALLSAVARIAVERDCGRLEWAVLDWNEPAIRFYRRRGARMLSDWKLCRVTGDALTNLASL